MPTTPVNLSVSAIITFSTVPNILITIQLKLNAIYRLVLEGRTLKMLLHLN